MRGGHLNGWLGCLGSQWGISSQLHEEFTWPTIAEARSVVQHDDMEIVAVVADAEGFWYEASGLSSKREKK
jgi:hypothetical protein